jgi:glycosyltransferase involved in cell wall biosynthesis
MRVALLTTDSREHFKDYANPAPYFGTAPEALLEGFKALPSEVEVHVVCCLQEPPVSSPRKLAENIHYHALVVRNLGWMKTGYQGCIRAVRRKLRDIRPDIVHGQGTERDCAVSAVLSGFPNVLTIHGNMRLIAGFLGAKPFTYYWLAARLEKFCLRRTAGVVAISTYTREAVQERTPKTWLVPNAVHPSFFEVVPRPAAPPRVLCVANIDRRKNQLGLIRSLDEVVRGQPVELRFAGRGHEDSDYFREFAAAVGQRPWCRHLGALGRADLQRELASATALVLPSFEDNCPMVILEAAAAGVPAAASRVGGIPDLVEDGQTGLLFSPEDPGGIAAAVGRLLADRGLADRLARRAHEICGQRFAPAEVARRHLEVYREVTGRHLPSVLT